MCSTSDKIRPGVGRFRVRGAAGTEITFRYSDVLTETGEIDVSAIGCFIKSGEFQTDKYIKKSDGEEEWNAIFTYHGFQYIEVSGIDYEPKLSDVSALTLCTDVENIGMFSCSDELLGKLQQLCRWSTISNMHSIPTDCPHREKNGWTGDVSLSSEQMLTNFARARSFPSGAAICAPRSVRRDRSPVWFRPRAGAITGSWDPIGRAR